ncbi:unnamed protein product [Miscanthus lutarioriparius]|uniref:Uncharacterized protein n=1 Tax=Miscanthus lutarioriparius TaxID=422564 RepID=A0A811RWY8_9POAL|nr:unnamed protein product [Miscanthus lutarioriparius]
MASSLQGGEVLGRTEPAAGGQLLINRRRAPSASRRPSPPRLAAAAPASRRPSQPWPAAAPLHGPTSRGVGPPSRSNGHPRDSSAKGGSGDSGGFRFTFLDGCGGPETTCDGASSPSRDGSHRSNGGMRQLPQRQPSPHRSAPLLASTPTPSVIVASTLPAVGTPRCLMEIRC